MFDLDGTLYDRDELVERVVIQQYDAFQTELSTVPKELFTKRVLELDDHGCGDKPTLYATVVREWGLAPELTDRSLRVSGPYTSRVVSWRRIPA